MELRERAVNGDVTPDTPVRIGKEGEWVLARRLSNLFDEHGRPIPHQKYMKAMSISSALAFREIDHAPPSEELLSAISYMAGKHQGQFRKDGETPYASHPMRVVAILMLGFGVDDPAILTAAALHDVIEDTSADFDELEELFGDTVAGYVAALSKDRRLREDEREKVFLQQLVKAPVAVKLCKLADTYDDGRGQPQFEKVKASFLDHTGQCDLARVAVHADFDTLSRLVANPAMQRILQTPRSRVEFRRAVAFEPTANQQFIKAIEPAQAAWLAERHKVWMHRSRDGRLPADFRIAVPGLPHVHATRWHNDKGELSVVNRDGIDAV